MKKDKTHRELFFPALRAKMGDWTYYISFMRMKDIAERIDIAEDIHESKSLNELLQRAVTARANDIAKYLETQKQRFFNSIIIGVYGGSPQWYELSVKKNERFDSTALPDYLEGVMGYLRLNGGEDLFAIDGQHRVAAITESLKKKSGLGEEEVSVIFVSAKQDSASRQRTRRLFSTLNRYAKPVKPRDIIVLDEDDTIAIITRQMINEYKLFKNDRINTKSKGKNIPSNDNRCITTIVSLHDTLGILLKDKNTAEWEDFLKIRPDDKIITGYYERAVSYWDGLQKYFKELWLLKENKLAASGMRHKNGGHLLFRPIGLQIITEVVKQLLDNGISLDKALRRISGVDFELSNKPWSGLLWESINKKMIIRKENQMVAKKLLCYMVNLDVPNTDETKLKKDYASAINWEKDIENLELPPRIGQKA